MRILAALGGNALSHDNVEIAATALAELATEHELIVTHGNEALAAALELALRNALPDRDVVNVLTQVVVDPDEAHPEPRAFAEIRSLRTLVEAGAVVICAAGGSVPVAMDELGALSRVEAAIDEDLTAALLARRLDAEMLLMLTDADAVHADWGGPRQHPLAHVTAHELRELNFATGSMGSKVEAACRFVEAGGACADIGSLDEAGAVIAAQAGTVVRPAVVGAVR